MSQPKKTTSARYCDTCVLCAQAIRKGDLIAQAGSKWVDPQCWVHTHCAAAD